MFAVLLIAAPAAPAPPATAPPQDPSTATGTLATLPAHPLPNERPLDHAYPATAWPDLVLPLGAYPFTNEFEVALSAFWADSFAAGSFSTADPLVVRLPPVDPPLPDTGPIEEYPLLLPPGIDDAEIVPAGEETPSDEACTPETGPKPAKEARKPDTTWERSLEMGVDGSEGNTQSLTFRCGADVKRTTPLNVLALHLDYRKKSSSGRETANRAYFTWRDDFPVPERPYSWFLRGTVEYDEFQTYHLRITAHAGAGYEWLKNEQTKLTSRLGAGFSREVQDPADIYVPEGIVAWELEHKLSSRQKVSGSMEYMPDLSYFASFRMTARAAWEILLDDKSNLSLKLSLLDRYNAQSHGKKPNDLDYAALLLWKF
ncbi:MAG: DUF481 domain-containing protein [Planctomycetota bacterium]